MTVAPKTRTENKVVHLLPEGRLVVNNLFERDIYKDPENGAEGKAKYKAVMVFEPKDVTGEGTFEDKLAEAIEAAYGVDTANQWLEGEKARPDRISPLKDGDAIAADRASRGKNGDAYKGKLALSADSIYNKDGVEGPGGFKVYGPDALPIGVANQSEVYIGCYGRMAVTISTYKDYPRKGDRGVKCYLAGFQKTRDGEPLRSEGGSNPFSPVAGATSAPAEAGVRRRRVG